MPSGTIVPDETGMRNSLLPRLSALVLFGALSFQAHAQISVDRESVSLNPANAGERVADLTVTNNGRDSLQLSVQLEDWDVDATGASHWKKAGAVAGSCGKRISVSPSAVQLAPGEKRVVRVALKSDARFEAECWSAAVLRSENVNAKETKSAAEQSSVPLFVTPSGLEVDGELSDMFVVGDSLEVVYKNIGKQRTNIVGEVQVQLDDESVVTTIPITSTTVLAGATRRLRFAMPKLAKGKYVLVALVDFGGEQLTAVQAALDMRE